MDDIADNRSVLNDLLSPLGFEMVEAINGQDGLDKIAEIQPDLIIMDLVMPVLNGFDAIRQLRANETTSHQKVIAASASSTLSKTDLLQQYAFDDFIYKPIYSEQLFQLLKEHLDLEWITLEKHPEKRATETELILPSLAEIEKLQQLAMMGDIASLKVTIEGFKTDYPIASRQLTKLIDNYSVGQLKKLLTHWHQKKFKAL